MADVSRPTTVHALHDWEVTSGASEDWLSVRLPHDAMIHETRDANAAGGADVAYFPGGTYVYRTRWSAPIDASPHAELFFEGVQGDATVALNGAYVGSVRSGYSEACLPVGDQIRWGEDNEITVTVDNSLQPSGRWYPGSGLYRPVSLVLRPTASIAPDGLRLHTRTLSPESATLDVTFRLDGDRPPGSRLTLELRNNGIPVSTGAAAEGSGTVTLDVVRPVPWTAETPHLYDLVARIEHQGAVVDERVERVGLRTIELDAKRGLRINGATVKLRGACIHHDNGPLGAATHRAAEYRRIRLLKAAGFNAVRSAHNPMSRHLLDACDELGMYVLDELADYWYVRKTTHDFSWRFRDTWREDARRMVEKDRNRASVIMYAAGNEIPETATPDGVQLTREITHYLHELDPNRPVTVALNLFLNTLVSFDKSPYKERSNDEDTSMAGSTEANVMINQIGRMMDIVSRLPRADKASRDAFAAVDVAGYNYGLGRYGRDVRHYPDRIILGSETLPGDVARAWHLVQKHDAVIGDFVWAGWEYLGEAGVSVWVPGKRAGLSKPYPYIVSGPGMFDLTGQPDITLRLAQAAWGRLAAPAIGVRPVNLSGVPMVRSAWRKTDAVESWSWRGCDGRTAEIEVYSPEDVVELVVNGRSLGRKRAGRRRGYRATFTAPYEPGTLAAISYRGGVEMSRTILRSSDGPLHVDISTESSTVRAHDDLIFANIALVDGNGTVEMLADEPVRVSVSGPGDLIAFGTAAAATTEAFDADRRTTFRGRALAIVRPTGETGTITITARAHSLGEAHMTVEALPTSLAPEIESMLP